VGEAVCTSNRYRLMEHANGLAQCVAPHFVFLSVRVSVWLLVTLDTGAYRTLPLSHASPVACCDSCQESQFILCG
ncbi:MAG: hypothetical protein ACXVAV_09845, partial [Ktedonobacteraceae bacterium]